MNIKSISVILNGLSPLMFDAFRGQEEIPPERKIYLAKDGRSVILPASNIVGFLTTKKTVSCLRAFTNSKDWKIKGPEIIGSVSVDPISIPFTDGGEPIVFDDWDDKIYLDERMAMPSTTARVIARRPVMELPWELDFTLHICETEFVTEERMRDWFERGGLMVGLCAYRPLFGRFEVSGWS